MEPWITFQNKIGYEFKNPHLLAEALTHKSFAYENGGSAPSTPHNERLEFLGDAVVDLAVSKFLMDRDSQASEGDLSKKRASLVNEATLAEIAREIDLSDHLILGRGEVQSQGKTKNSILASALEAVLGATFLDGGFDASLELAHRLFASRCDSLSSAREPFAKDYKTRLQETIQALHKTIPTYRLERAEGPDHRKSFHVAVFLGQKKMGEGSGKSRKEAEQEAAKNALENELWKNSDQASSR